MRGDGERSCEISSLAPVSCRKLTTASDVVGKSGGFDSSRKHYCIRRQCANVTDRSSDQEPARAGALGAEDRRGGQVTGNLLRPRCHSLESLQLLWAHPNYTCRICRYVFLGLVASSLWQGRLVEGAKATVRRSIAPV